MTGGSLRLFALLSYCVALRAQVDPTTIVNRLDTVAESAFKDTHCPGLSVAVARRNVVVYSKAFGYSDIEQGVPLTTTSAHRLASVSKLITGTIIMDPVGPPAARRTHQDVLGRSAGSL